jgi:tetratricopeptide (TPR) repeat protein
VHEIVKGAVKEGRGAEIGAVCEALAGQEREGGVWMGMGEVLAGVYGGDDAVVDAGTDRLVERYGADERCVEAMGQIAYAFRQVKKFERAGQYYQYVVDTWPHGKRAVFSVRGLVWMREALGDAAGAGAALDKLLVEYKDDADFVECVRPLADSFEQKKDYNTAIRIHQYVSDNRPGDGMAVWSQFKVFKIALAELKDETLARGAYNRVVERFGGHGRIAQVMCEAAWEYRKLNRHAEAMGPDNIVFCRTALHYRYERPHY